MTAYTAFLLTNAARRSLLDRFPPLYSMVKADHITYRFGQQGFGDLFHPRAVEVIGMVDSGDGLQALIVTVNGQQYRPDGGPYHITWSLDPKKYEAVHSNQLVSRALELGFFTRIAPPVKIDVSPALITKPEEGPRTVLEFPRPPSFGPSP